MHHGALPTVANGNQKTPLDMAELSLLKLLVETRDMPLAVMQADSTGASALPLLFVRTGVDNTAAPIWFRVAHYSTWLHSPVWSLAAAEQMIDRWSIQPIAENSMLFGSMLFDHTAPREFRWSIPDSFSASTIERDCGTKLR